MRIIINKLWQFKLPLILLGIILFAVCVGPMLPASTQQFLYAISLSLKELLVFVLPFIVFSLILSSIVHLKQGAVKLIVLLIPLLCLSNFIATWIAYFAGDMIVHKANLSVVTGITTEELDPTWKLNLPVLAGPLHAIVLAVFLGLLTAIKPLKNSRLVNFVLKIANVCNKITIFVLNKLVLPLLPLMILGFVIKMQYEDVLTDLMQGYAFVFGWVAVLQIAYILPWYIILAKFKPSVWLNYLKNMIPPFITGFSTMSSAATMPLTLIATRKNVHDPDIVNFVIPSTVNYHLVADVLAMPIFAMTLMVSFGMPFPSLGQYLAFSIYYTIARFTGAAIPGGGALIISALAVEHFNFTGEMVALVYTLNLVFDSMITSMNIMGNGAFAILFNKLYHWKKQPATTISTA